MSDLTPEHLALLRRVAESCEQANQSVQIHPDIMIGLLERIHDLHSGNKMLEDRVVGHYSVGIGLETQLHEANDRLKRTAQELRRLIGTCLPAGTLEEELGYLVDELDPPEGERGVKMNAPKPETTGIDPFEGDLHADLASELSRAMWKVSSTLTFVETDVLAKTVLKTIETEGYTIVNTEDLRVLMQRTKVTPNRYEIGDPLMEAISRLTEQAGHADRQRTYALGVAREEKKT